MKFWHAKVFSSFFSCHLIAQNYSSKLRVINEYPKLLIEYIDVIVAQG